MKLKIAKTPEGIVFRRIWPSGEDAWRKTSNDEWYHCVAHKGPWVGVRYQEVPHEVLVAAAALTEDMPLA